MKAITAKPAALWAAPVGLIALLGLIVAFTVAKPAHADGGTASSSVTAVAFKQVVLKGLVVADEHIKVDHKSPTMGAKWFKTCMNSSTVLGQYHGGHIVQYVDHHCLLQRDSHSPTGWVKRGGGKTGRDCRNIAAPPPIKMPYPKVKHFVSVESFDKLLVNVHVTAKAHAEVHASCGSASGNGVSSDWIKISYSAYAKARSNETLRERLAATIIVRAKDKAVANANVSCTPGTTTQPGTTTSPPPPTTTTTTTTQAPPTQTVKNVTSPEEATADGAVYRNLCADVFAKNGDSITLVFSVVKTNDHSQSGFGSIVIQRSLTFTSNGFDRICGFAYQAPTDSTAVGQSDQLEATIHDNTNTNIKDASAFSQPFKIIASPPQV
jgi:hypothetical protein